MKDGPAFRLRRRSLRGWFRRASAHEPATQRLFIVHGIDDPADSPASSIEIVSVPNPAAPVKVGANLDWLPA